MRVSYLGKVKQKRDRFIDTSTENQEFNDVLKYYIINISQMNKCNLKNLSCRTLNINI